MYTVSGLDNEKTPATIGVEFIDPEFTYVKVYTDVLYDINNTTKTTADLQTIVQSAISQYNTTYLANFKKTLYVSDLLSAVSTSDSAIIGADVELFVTKRFIPTTNADYTTTLYVHNALMTEEGIPLSAAETHYGHTMRSSSFTYNGTRSILVDDTKGTVYVANQTTTGIEIAKSIGTIDYVTGVIQLTNFNVDAYEGNYIELILRPLSQNIVGFKNIILQIGFVISESILCKTK
jgi:hypothetical protein